MRTLSSLQTLPYKFILPGFWLLIWGTVVFQLFFQLPAESHQSEKGAFLFTGIVLALFVYWSGIRLKAVSVDEKFLYVSNYIKEISVPLSQIDHVTQNKWINNHPVTIYLKSPCEFGDRIVFMPKTRFFEFGPHPVVEELRILARSNNQA